ncbi:AAA family ATPase [Richelia sinica]|nr:ATP-binding protein [Richelia sinica]MBD2665658.1 AAA family ATPase [Richelia sinica FACHB-800]
MLKTIKIENFRCFQFFELQQLGRINLLVGENNSGKTSILEAIQLLCSRTNLEPLGEIMINRGEYFWSDEPRGERELDICHLFYEHQFDIDSQFSISGFNNNNNEEKFSMKIGKPTLNIDLNELDQESKRKIIENLSTIDINNLNCQFVWQLKDESHESQQEMATLPLSDNNCLFFRDTKRFNLSKTNEISNTILVNSSSLNTIKMKELFDEIVLTPEEELVTESLRIIEPKIERIATANVQKSTQIVRLRSTADSHTGFFVRLSDKKQRVPIGSMGDGVWRILGLALAIVSAKDGYLFVDEIDTGLHFTTMSGMWRMIWETAKRLNVQVFATTHSNDCWKSLADIAETENVTDDGIRIHRIEKGKENSIVFDESEIVIAAEENIEVR